MPHVPPIPQPLYEFRIPGDDQTVTVPIAAPKLSFPHSRVVRPLLFVLMLLLSFAACIGSAALQSGWAVLGSLIVLTLAFIGGLITLVGNNGKLTAGNDGISLRWLGTRRYISYRDITGLREAGGGSWALYLASGERIWIAPSSAFPKVAARLHEEIASARRARESGAGMEEALRRGTSTLDEWFERLDRINPSGSDYRAAPLDRAALMRLATDGNAEPTARAGAIFVLRRLGMTVDETEALRLAARETAHPKVRVVLETVPIDADDERVRDAIRAVAP